MKDKAKLIIYAVIGLIVIVVVIRVLRTGKRRARQSAKAEKKLKKQDVKKSAENLRGLEQFNPDFKQFETFARLGDPVAGEYADNLRKAVRGWGTNEEVIYSIFGRLKNKANISEISAQYYLKYRRDLLVDLLDDLNNKEQAILFNIIQKLPNIS